MILQINNIIDILKLLAGLIAIVVMLRIFVPWRFVYELIVLTLLVMLIAVSFWISEGWRAVKKVFRKRSKWIELPDHDLFI